MYKFTNLTPHVLNIILASGEVMRVEPSGKVARVAAHYVEHAGLTVGNDILPTFHVTYDDVDLSLFESDDPNEVFIVSGMVFSAIADRHPDWYPENLICAPGELVRDADGKPIGCKGLKTP